MTSKDGAQRVSLQPSEARAPWARFAGHSVRRKPQTLLRDCWVSAIWDLMRVASGRYWRQLHADAMLFVRRTAPLISTK